MVGFQSESPKPCFSSLSELRAACLPARPARVLPTGLGLDQDLPHGGLAFGKVHEWLGVLEPDETPGGKRWSPPLTLLTHLVRGALERADNAQARVLWITRRGAASLTPFPASFAGEGARDALACSIFVYAPLPEQRLWAIDLALRSRAATAVVADGTGLDLAATRRLQLAAEASGAICLLARPPWEHAALSASATRWLIRSAVSPSHSRRWTVSLLRCKGTQPAPEATRLWTLERDHATRTFALVPDVRERSGEAAPGTRQRWG